MSEGPGREALPLRYRAVFSTPPSHSPWRAGVCRPAAGNALVLTLPERLPPGTILHMEIYWPEERAVVELTGEVLTVEGAGPAPAAGEGLAHRVAVLTISEEGRSVLLEALSGPSGGDWRRGAPGG
jgi:hypothetical protein